MNLFMACSHEFTEAETPLLSRFQSLESTAQAQLITQGFRNEDIKIYHFLNCRYEGVDKCFERHTNLPPFLYHLSLF
jgi:N-methylhydantoinase A/oxoprolinase/acetone carboxylase beta subunit